MSRVCPFIPSKAGELELPLPLLGALVGFGNLGDDSVLDLGESRFRLSHSGLSLPADRRQLATPQIHPPAGADS